MKWFFSLLLGLLVVISLVVLRAPASLVPKLLAEAETRQLLPPDAPRLKLMETSGTIWDGVAAKSELTIDKVTLDLGEFSWQLDMLALLDKRLVLQLAANAVDHQLAATIVAVNETDLNIHDVEGRLPISKLEPWLPMLVKGDIAFVIDHIELKQQRLTAIDGVLNLEYVDWLGGDKDMPLGSYMAQIYLQQNNVQVQLNDFAASLGVNGLLSVAPSGSYTFKATLQPRSGLAPEVAETLGWLGKRSANGDVIINRRGRF